MRHSDMPSSLRPLLQMKQLLAEVVREAHPTKWVVVQRNSGDVVGRVEFKSDDKHVLFVGKVWPLEDGLHVVCGVSMSANETFTHQCI